MNVLIVYFIIIIFTSILTGWGAIVLKSDDLPIIHHFLFVNPIDIYKQTKLNIVGTIVVYILYIIFFPIPAFITLLFRKSKEN